MVINKTFPLRLISLLAMTAVLLCGLCACGGDSDDDSAAAAPEEVAEEFIEAYWLRDYLTQFEMLSYDGRAQWEAEVIEDLGSKEAFFTVAQQQADEKGIEVTVDSFDAYFAAYRQYILESSYELYGDYTLTTTATQTVKMTEDLLPQFRENLLSGPSADYMDAEMLVADTEVYTISVNIIIDGTKQDYNEVYLVYVIRHAGQWLVADYSA